MPAKIRLKLVCRPLNFKYVQSFDRSIKVNDLMLAVESDLSYVTGTGTKIIQITTRDHYALLGHSEIMDVLVDEDVLMVYVVKEDTHADDVQIKCGSLVKKPAKKVPENRKETSGYTSIGDFARKMVDSHEGQLKKRAEERHGLCTDAKKFGKETKESSESKPTKEKSKADLLSRNREEQKIVSKKKNEGKTLASGEENQKEKLTTGEIRKEAVQDHWKMKNGDEKTEENSEMQRSKDGDSIAGGGVSKKDVFEEKQIPEKFEKKKKVFDGDSEGEKMIPLKKKTASHEEGNDSIFK